jgi:hypothetical protein
MLFFVSDLSPERKTYIYSAPLSVLAVNWIFDIAHNQDEWIKAKAPLRQL